ncbi:MAG: hypothetical protein D6692_01735 [Planctomycetota bacterium]|nr:MAG: hypothetical protein D6692_01735 [Planctomycetota bacterium]
MAKNKSEGYMFLRRGIWQSRKVIKGREYTWSTKTGNRALAVRRARDHWAAVIAGEYALVDRQASRRRCATLGEVVEAYLRWPTDRPKRRTRRNNVSALRRVVELGQGRSWDPSQPVTVLTAELVRAFQFARLREVHGAEPEVVERARFGANSTLNQARSVFASAEPWRLAKIDVPELQAFMRAPRFKGVQIDCEFRPFGREELDALLAALEQAWAEQDPVYLPAALMLFGGLRNSEVARARRDWLERDGAGAWVHVRVSKTVRGRRRVPLPPQVWARVEALAGREWLLPGGTATERHNLATRRLNSWLSGVLPGREAYDLRRQAGSWVLDEQGLVAAANFLGHRGTETTVRWYASRIRGLKPVKILRAAGES